MTPPGRDPGVRILGIDPGSRITGYGIVELVGQKAICIANGCLRVGDGEIAQRLRHIFTGLQEILEQYQPQEMAIESVFVHRNVDSALKLGQARGVLISAVALNDIPVDEYSPTQIKKAVVGKGNASKAQVQHMVKAILGLGKAPAADAADALAVALCHGYHRQTAQRAPQLEGVRFRRR
ncbi:MAG: crossover junction endodeoxyribonuclease RuvC [Gammaproteobacteria bacterium]